MDRHLTEEKGATCYLTEEGRSKLKKKKEELQKKRKKFRIEEGAVKVRSHSCNNEFISIKRHGQGISRKIRRIDSILKNAKVIKQEDIPTDKVGIGSKVTLCFPAGEKREYVVGIKDPDCDNEISLQAPLSVIIGKKPGEIVRYKANGEASEVEILNIL